MLMLDAGREAHAGMLRDRAAELDEAMRLVGQLVPDGTELAVG
jgi:hypothetical protein